MDDTIVSQAGADIIDGEDGFDTLTYAGSDDGISINFIGNGTGGHAEGDAISNIEKIIGSAFDDRITFGSSFGPTIEFFGEDGNDAFDIGGVRFPISDALTFDGGTGSDLLKIHTGIDNLGADGTISAFAGSIFKGGDDFDTLQVRGGGALDFRVVTLESFERLIFDGNVENFDVTFSASQFEQFEFVNISRRGTLDINIHMEDQVTLDISDFNVSEGQNGSPQDFHIIGDSDAENIIGSNSSDEIIGNDGRDTIDGGEGSDIIDGGKGRDFVTGGLGDDSIAGQGGNDDLFGGKGLDTILGGAGDDTIDGGADSDFIAGGKGNDVINGGAGKDEISGGSSGDTIDGGAAADEISGGGGKDDINGGGGADDINGGGGADVIKGGSAADSIDGGNGADSIDGGSGDDLLTGGAGSDVFVFVGNFGQDTITDFDANNNAEEIDLSTIAAITDFADLRDNHLVEVEGGVVIDILDGNTITLLGTNIDDLNNTDFIFDLIA